MMIKVTLKDGSIKEYAESVSIKAVAEGISAALARVALVGEVDGVVKDLSFKIESDCTLKIQTFEEEGGKK